MSFISSVATFLSTGGHWICSTSQLACLDLINTFHLNNKFTMDPKCNGHLSFLDILVPRFNGKFVTGIFRKKTFTGLGLKF